ncbi:MAG: hypothetical protein ACHQ49_07565 [Elusimicrobiota bacterium]
MTRTESLTRKQAAATALKAALCVLTFCSLGRPAGAAARSRIATAPRSGARNRSVSIDVPPVPKRPPRIKILVSQDGKSVTVRIERERGDVSLHGVLRAPPQGGGLAPRADASVAAAMPTGSKPRGAP